MEKSTFQKRSMVIIEAFIMMIALQAIRELAEVFISPYYPDTRFNAKMITMSIMIVLRKTP